MTITSVPVKLKISTNWLQISTQVTHMSERTYASRSSALALIF